MNDTCFCVAPRYVKDHTDTSDSLALLPMVVWLRKLAATASASAESSLESDSSSLDPLLSEELLMSFAAVRFANGRRREPEAVSNMGLRG